MKSAGKHWLLLRLSALPLIPLVLYFLTQVEHLTTKNRHEFVSWAAQPLNTTALLLFIFCAFYHGCGGIGEIIEDYIPAARQRSVLLSLNKIIFAALGLVSIYALLAINIRTH
ncbi:MAG: succinate dehydrogenase, hydrophobic membrane anchor protein [Proteobacteria bacterium]|nr:succinate dehydrogenase, hydrophobic membrane anchor protein [Pseudomonadota bacterium]